MREEKEAIARWREKERERKWVWEKENIIRLNCSQTIGIQTHINVYPLLHEHRFADFKYELVFDTEIGNRRRGRGMEYVQTNVSFQWQNIQPVNVSVYKSNCMFKMLSYMYVFIEKSIATAENTWRWSVVELYQTYTIPPPSTYPYPSPTRQTASVFDKPDFDSLSHTHFTP